MKSDKTVSRPLLVRVLFFMLLACVVVDGAGYWIIHSVAAKVPISSDSQPDTDRLAALAQSVQAAPDRFWVYGVPASLIFFAVLALVLWRVLVRCCRRSVSPVDLRRPMAAAAQPTAEQVQQKADTDHRLFLHLLSVLQKEGRLMDFFSENLSQYADAQIGAAVRDIHENCKKAIDKYVAPQSVLDQEEGESITVEADFDPNAVKLIGNVTGRPPFTGIVRHRGWRARKTELPTLSGRQDPGLISPAEVEVS